MLCRSPSGRPPPRVCRMAQVGDYFRGKVVWITGASSGLGEALAIALARKAKGLILSARREEALRRVAERCGGEVLPLDLKRLEDLPEKAAKAKAIYGQVGHRNSGATWFRSDVVSCCFTVVLGFFSFVLSVSSHSRGLERALGWFGDVLGHLRRFWTSSERLQVDVLVNNGGVGWS